MKKASVVLTPEQRAQVEQAIAQAEQRTSAQIVVAIATRSGRYDRAEDTFGVLLGLLAVTVAWVVFQDLNPATEEWTAGHELTLGLIPILLLFAFWWVVGIALATRFPILSRLFASRMHREAEVRRRGFEVFHLYHVGGTRARTGVLIYVSLVEHMALVCGDSAVNAALPDSTWNDAVQSIASASREGRLHEGLTKSVGLVGAALETKFPREPGDTDELPNTVHILD